MDGQTRSAGSLQPPARGSHRRAAKSPSELTGDLTKLIVRAAGAVATSAPAPPAPSSELPAPGRHHAEPAAPPPSEPESPRLRFDRRTQVIAGVCLAAAALIVVPLLLLWTPGADASGTTTSPPSRGYACRPGSQGRDTSAACRAALAVRPATGDDSGSGLGDGTDIGIPDVGDRHREVIPDTRLCSAGRERYRGLDLARDDWPATAVTSGATITLQYRLDDRRAGLLRFYLTKTTYDANKPLTWADLDTTPLGQASGQPGRDNTYRVEAQLPSRSGRQLIYTIWEDADDDSALYACSDVVFGGAASAPPAKTPRASAPSSAPKPSTAPASAGQPSSSPSSGVEDNGNRIPDWTPGTEYDAGDEVVYAGKTYRCLQPHTSVYGWEPDSAVAFWELATDAAPAN
ncbi:lytic polysaccharide monooxygenase [Cryptosporangium phraense]|uniref:lytic polysaccharide monooxygenase n=1 Tax=Cryptosporangium phraense TaxID=2593070 RepID=UPI001479197A|nr:lytic polysaccharide monooxygenase [Cryptosporangium phraense]